MNFTHFNEIFLQHRCFHCAQHAGPKYPNTENTRLDIVVIAKQCLKCLLQRRITFRTLFRNRIHVVPMIITVSTLLSLSQLGKGFKLHVVQTCKLTLFSWGNIDYTMRISLNVWIKHVFSMKFTHHVIFLQQGCLHCTIPNGSKYSHTEKTRLDRGFMAKQCVYWLLQREITFTTYFCDRMHASPMIITAFTLLSLLQLKQRFKLHVVTKRKLTLFLWGNIE